MPKRFCRHRGIVDKERKSGGFGIEFENHGINRRFFELTGAVIVCNLRVGL